MVMCVEMCVLPRVGTSKGSLRHIMPLKDKVAKLPN